LKLDLLQRGIEEGKEEGIFLKGVVRTREGGEP